MPEQQQPLSERARELLAAQYADPGGFTVLAALLRDGNDISDRWIVPVPEVLALIEAALTPPASPTGEDALVERLQRRFCQEACAECGEPPCWEIAGPDWRTDGEETETCNCASLARVAAAEFAAMSATPALALTAAALRSHTEGNKP